jgi:hypothetical protein
VTVTGSYRTCAPLPAGVKVNPGDGVEELQPHRWNTHAHDVTGGHEDLLGGAAEPELMESRNEPRYVPGMKGYPDVQIAGGAGIAVIGDRNAADDEILNLLRVQQR